MVNPAVPQDRSAYAAGEARGPIEACRRAQPRVKDKRGAGVVSVGRLSEAAASSVELKAESTPHPANGLAFSRIMFRLYR